MYCTYNVTLRRVRVTAVAGKKLKVVNSISVCLYSCLGYPACKSHLSCIVLFVICGLFRCTIFFKLSHERHDFWKKFLTVQYMFAFLRSFCLKYFSF
jgi:hypothetical protein